MKEIIAPVDKSLIIAELSPSRFLRKTNFGDRELFVINGNECPYTMLEIGRLRELSFRDAGGGTGKELDIDSYDYGTYAYNQLVLWNPEEEEIIGGYRFVHCNHNRDESGKYHLSTSEIVDYSEKLKNHIFPFTIELGRSFIQPKYQATGADRRNIYGMDNLWDGLGALIVLYPWIKYFFGKVTMYTNYNPAARDYLLAFMHQFFPDPDILVHIPYKLQPQYDTTQFVEKIAELDYKHAYIETNKMVRSFGENIPPLFNAYMKLSPTMRTLGTAANPHFGGVEETGILVTIADIYLDKSERHIDSFTPNPYFRLPEVAPPHEDIV
jgi:hypothetical protein